MYLTTHPMHLIIRPREDSMIVAGEQATKRDKREAFLSTFPGHFGEVKTDLQRFTAQEIETVAVHKKGYEYHGVFQTHHDYYKFVLSSHGYTEEKLDPEEGMRLFVKTQAQEIQESLAWRRENGLGKAFPTGSEKQESSPKPKPEAPGASKKIGGEGGQTRYTYPDEVMKKKNKRAGDPSPKGGASDEEEDKPQPEPNSPQDQDPEGGPPPPQPIDPIQTPQPTEKSADPADLANQLHIPVYMLRQIAKRFNENKKLKGRDGFISFMKTRLKSVVEKHKLDDDYFGLVFDALTSDDKPTTPANKTQA